MVGITGSAIYDALKNLLRRRSTTPAATEPESLFEIHITTEPDGVSRRRLLLRTDREDILEHALSHFADGLIRPEPILEWDDTFDNWIEP